MIGWIAKTWGHGTATEDVPPTERLQAECVHTHQESRRSTSNRTLEDIVIEGSDLFVNHVNHCFEEIRDTKWEFTVTQIRKIVQVSSGAYATSGGLVSSSLKMLGHDTWNNDYVEGAATLIHEAVHVIRVSNNVFAEDYYSAEEKLAFKYEAEFLRSRGRHGRAAQVEGADGRHNERNMSAELLASQR